MYFNLNMHEFETIHELKLTNKANTSSQNKETVNCTHLYVFLCLFSAAKTEGNF
jgi:hypothetical protein